MKWTDKALAEAPISAEYAENMVNKGRGASPSVTRALVGMILELGGWGAEVPDERPLTACATCDGEGKVTDDEYQHTISDLNAELENDDSGRAEMALAGIDWKSCPDCGGAGYV